MTTKRTNKRIKGGDLAFGPLRHIVMPRLNPKSKQSTAKQSAAVKSGSKIKTKSGAHYNLRAEKLQNARNLARKNLHDAMMAYFAKWPLPYLRTLAANISDDYVVDSRLAAAMSKNNLWPLAMKYLQKDHRIAYSLDRVMRNSLKNPPAKDVSLAQLYKLCKGDIDNKLSSVMDWHNAMYELQSSLKIRKALQDAMVGEIKTFTIDYVVKQIHSLGLYPPVAMPKEYEILFDNE